MTRILAITALVIIRELLGRAMFNEFAGEGVRLSLNFGFLLLAAHLMGQAFARVRMPMITGYIAAGILFGPFGLEYINVQGLKDLRFIDDIALTFIALAAGGELRISTLREKWPSVLNLVIWITLIVFFGVFASFVAAAGVIPFMKGMEPRQVFMIAAGFGILCVARSPSSTIAIISECKAKGPYSETVLGVTVATDVIVIVLFTLLLSVYGRICSVGTGDMISIGLIGEILVSFGAGTLLGWVITLYIRRVKADLVIFLVGTAFLVTKFSHGLGAFLELHYGTTFHLEPMLICMAAGFIIQNFSHEGGRFLGAIDRSSLPIYATFFAITGASIDLGALRTSWHIAFALVMVRALLMVLGARFATGVTREPARMAGLYGLGFLTQAGVSLGLVQVVAHRYPEWGVPFATIAVAAIAINQVVGPIAFKYALERAGEAKATKRRSSRQ